MKGHMVHGLRVTRKRIFRTVLLQELKVVSLRSCFDDISKQNNASLAAKTKFGQEKNFDYKLYDKILNIEDIHD